MRTLIYVPVIHYRGCESNEILSIKARDLDEILTKEKPKHITPAKESIKFSFEGIRQCLDNEEVWSRALKELSCLKVDKIYLDSYDGIYTTKNWIRKLANKGNKEAQLILELEKNGGNLTISEEGVLLNLARLEKEKGIFSRISYGILRVIIPVFYPNLFPLYTNRKRNTAIDWRDFHIAYRINSTLNKDETGILLIGGAHNVEEIIKRNYPDINIKYYTGFVPGISVSRLSIKET